jgi:osmotically-inducible protein OsmY
MIKSVVFVVACLLAVPAYAGELPEDDPTPRERVVESEAKHKLNPELRGRWNPEAQKPASEASLPSDVSAEEILRILKTDENLKDSAFKVKVTAENGAVTLEGVVNDEAEKLLIGEKAKIENVKSVDNRLTVKTTEN